MYSTEHISRSVPCKKEAPTHNISAEEISQSVPLCLEYKEPLTLSKISRSVPCKKEAPTHNISVEEIPDPFLSVQIERALN